MPDLPTQPEPQTSDAASALPTLSPRHQHLLDLFASHDFNFTTFAKAAGLTASELSEFASCPDVQAHLDAVMDLARRSLHLRATRARHIAIETLELLALDAGDPVEQRRAASQLLRATSAPVVGASRPRAAASGAAKEADPPPRPRAVPHPDHTPRQVVDHVVAAFRAMNDPDRDSGLATIAAFLDHDAPLNGTPIPTKSELKAIDALRETELPMFRDYRGTHDDEPPDIAEDRAVFHVWFALPHHKYTPRVLKLKLAKNPDSRHPGCWLIDSLSTGPPNYYRR